MAGAKREVPVGMILFVIMVAVIVLFVMEWHHYAQYASQEQDIVCYNDDCSVMSSSAYSVNPAGTCLTETDLFGTQSQDCGGKIDITKYPPVSFWQWLQSGSSTPNPESD